jgi:transposase
METVEGNSSDRNRARIEFEEKGKSLRKIGAMFGVSHTAVKKWVVAGKWKRSAKVETTERKPRCKPVDAPELAPPQIDPVVLSATMKYLTSRGRNIGLALMAELEFLNGHALTLSELVEAAFNGEKDGSIRAKLLKALDHETRTKSFNQLATALAKMNDAAPGKKEERQDNAEKSASAGRFAAPSAPKTVLQ